MSAVLADVATMVPPPPAPPACLLTFRFARGSGLAGLTAMAPVTQHVTGLLLVRPLLTIRKVRKCMRLCGSTGMGATVLLFRPRSAF